MEPQSPRSRSKAALTSARQPRLPAGCDPCEQFDLHVSKESLKLLFHGLSMKPNFSRYLLQFTSEYI